MAQAAECAAGGLWSAEYPQHVADLAVPLDRGQAVVEIDRGNFHTSWGTHPDNPMLQDTAE